MEDKSIALWLEFCFHVSRGGSNANSTAWVSLRSTAGLTIVGLFHGSTRKTRWSRAVDGVLPNWPTSADAEHADGGRC